MATKCKGWELYTNSNNYVAYTYNTATNVTSNNFTYDSYGTTSNIWGAQKGSSDTWVKNISLDGYSPSISVIKPGTYPEYDDDNLTFSDTGYWYKITKESDGIKIYRCSGAIDTAIDYNSNQWSYYRSMTNFKDGVVASNIFFIVQGAGAAGGNYSGSDSGGGGGSGACIWGIVDLDSAISSDGSSGPMFYPGKGGEDHFYNGGQGANGGNGEASKFVVGSRTTVSAYVVAGGGYGGDGGTYAPAKGGSGGSTNTIGSPTGVYVIADASGRRGGKGSSESATDANGGSMPNQNIKFSKTYGSNKISMSSKSGGSGDSGEQGYDGGGGGAASMWSAGGDCGYVPNSGSAYARPGAGHNGSGGGGGTDEEAYNINDIQGWGNKGGDGFIRIYV